jgi:hypothetical protein
VHQMHQDFTNRRRAFEDNALVQDAQSERRAGGNLLGKIRPPSNLVHETPSSLRRDGTLLHQQCLLVMLHPGNGQGTLNIGVGKLSV